MKMKDLTNNSYGCYTVLYELPRGNFNKRMWQVRCKCDKEYPILQDSLTISKSKGCPSCRTTFITHGLARKHRLYITWQSMRNRCNNINNKDYYLYGSRGIKVCNEWNSFLVFIADMDSSYRIGLSLDRIDTNGNYSKGNCKWSNNIEQANNRRNNLKIEFEGRIVTEAELSRITGVNRTTIQNRRNKDKSVEEMVYGHK